jgi:hypothetical protein
MGDQIQRLAKCPADVFIVQYWGQIDDAVLDQLENFAKLKSYLKTKQFVMESSMVLTLHVSLRLIQKALVNNLT